METAFAHSFPDQKIDLLSWNFSPFIFLFLTFLFFLYFRGSYRFPRAGHRSRYFFLAGLMTLLVALVSPVDPLSDKLASVHMVQHTLLMMVAAPLLVVARPEMHALVALGSVFKRFSWPRYLVKIYLVRRPLIIWALYALALWLWHLPYLYELALHHSIIHDLQHLSFFLTSYLFWRVVLYPRGENSLNAGVSILYVFVASLHAMILGVLMALSPVSWYSSYEATAIDYGLTALEDQQMAGFIMWMPACFTYFFVGIKQANKLLQRS